MGLKKTHKRKKYSRAHGRGMGTAGHGCRKNSKGKGHHGGKGMSGTGKRADQKKTLVLKLYGNDYFGKAGITSKRTERDKRKRINIGDIDSNIENYVKSDKAKKTTKGYEIILEDFKILGDGEVKNKLFIKALAASTSAIEKVEKAGGKIELKESKAEEKVETPKFSKTKEEKSEVKPVSAKPIKAKKEKSE